MIDTKHTDPAELSSAWSKTAIDVLCRQMDIVDAVESGVRLVLWKGRRRFHMTPTRIFRRRPYHRPEMRYCDR